MSPNMTPYGHKKKLHVIYNMYTEFTQSFLI